MKAPQPAHARRNLRWFVSRIIPPSTSSPPRIMDPARFRSGLMRRTMRVPPDDWMLDLTIPSKLQFVGGIGHGAPEPRGQNGIPRLMISWFLTLNVPSQQATMSMREIRLHHSD